MRARAMSREGRRSEPNREVLATGIDAPARVKPKSSHTLTPPRNPQNPVELRAGCTPDPMKEMMGGDPNTGFVAFLVGTTDESA